MLASQLIYTSWKNGESLKKGFMVYSKSNDISEEDTNEILKIMKYKPPVHLPYSPTKEEIEKMFPRNLTYFKLPSGKYCFAQACYVGQDYTNRWGNYIIHAYVIEYNSDFRPLSFIGSNIFRKNLTEAELNAAYAPEFLPKIEIPMNENAINEAEIKMFFTNNRLDNLKFLVQSIIENVDRKIKINLCDDFENIKYWFKALSLVLPKSILPKVTFASYMQDTYDGILISCLEQVQSSAYFNYGEENSIIVFDLKNPSSNENKVTNLYAITVCDKLITDYYETIIYVNNIEKRLITYNENNYNTLHKLLNFDENNLDIFTNADDLISIVEKVVASNHTSNLDVELKKVLDYLKMAPYNFEDVLRIFSLVDKYGSDSLKEIVVKDRFVLFVNNKSNLQPKELSEIIMQNFSNSKKIISELILNERILSKIIHKGEIYESLFTIYLLAYIYDNFGNTKNNSIVISFVEEHYLRILKYRDYASIKDINEFLKKTSNDLRKDLLNKTLGYVVEFLLNDLDNTFVYLDIFKEDTKYFWYVVRRIIEKLKDDIDEMVELYCQYTSIHSNISQEIEQYATDILSIQFLEKAKIVKYKNKDNLNIDELNELYNMCQKENNSDSYESNELSDFCYQKIRKYLDGFKNGDIILECSKIYNKIFIQQPIKDLKLLDLMKEYMFDKVALKELKDSKNIGNLIEELKKNFIECQINLPTKMLLYEEGMKICEVLKKPKYMQIESIKKMFGNFEKVKEQEKSYPSVTYIYNDIDDRTTDPYSNKAIQYVNRNENDENKDDRTTDPYSNKAIQYVNRNENDENKDDRTTDPYRNKEIKYVNRSENGENITEERDHLEYLYLSELNSIDVLKEYIDCFGGCFIRIFIVTLIDKNYDDIFENILDKFFGPFYKSKEFETIFSIALYENIEDINENIVKILNYGFNESSKFSKEVQDIIYMFFDQMNKKKLKKLLKSVEDKIANKKKYDNFIENYNKTKKNFFATLLDNIFNKK